MIADRSLRDERERADAVLAQMPRGLRLEA